eukprot:scaffold16158_cov115-Skeletonema_marinoi.AAC.3
MIIGKLWWVGPAAVPGGRLLLADSTAPRPRSFLADVALAWGFSLGVTTVTSAFLSRARAHRVPFSPIFPQKPKAIPQKLISSQCTTYILSVAATPIAYSLFMYLSPLTPIISEEKNSKIKH